MKRSAKFSVYPLLLDKLILCICTHIYVHIQYTYTRDRRVEKTGGVREVEKARDNVSYFEICNINMHASKGECVVESRRRDGAKFVILVA